MAEKDFIPSHLKKYLVAQNYKKYSPEDQAVWRFIMKGIIQNLSLHGYPGALEGLKKTGIYENQIPRITQIDKKLQAFGWRATCISGFIPPRAFMEFQKHKILPIASELRTLRHIFYTPAPDIVHEAVGHVPFLTNPLFSKFLSTYADVVLKSISSQQDMEKYKAIRDLSDIKENPRSTVGQIQKKERHLKKIIKEIKFVSESARLSRLIWWTSEYGLMGSLKTPKIYGAGLISSIGESLHIQKVKKIKLTEKCLNYPFDITDFQPQLFVAPNFEYLLELVTKISHKMAFKKGGLYAVEQACFSKSLNTVVLDSGLQISGQLDSFLKQGSAPVFLKFKRPVQLSYQSQQLKGHGKSYHKEGYSSPLALLSSNTKPIHLWNLRDLKKARIQTKQKVCLRFKGGIELKGELLREFRAQNRLLVLTFKNCLITGPNKEKLYDPSWGLFDLAIGSRVVSVFSGPADAKAYRLKEDFEPSKIPDKKISTKKRSAFDLYKKVAQLNGPDFHFLQKPKADKKIGITKEVKKKLFFKQIHQLIKQIKKQDPKWLLLLELLSALKSQPEFQKELLPEIESLKKLKVQNKPVFKLGKKFYKLK